MTARCRLSTRLACWQERRCGKRWVKAMSRQNILLRLVNFWPPFLGAGIRVSREGPDLNEFVVRMKLHRWNANYVGTQYGGSLYSMCDPFHMLILIHELGPNYVVWDKSARIRFLRPGRGTVAARFSIPAAEIERIRAVVDEEGRHEPVFTVQVTNGAGETVAEVEKTLSIRKRRE